MELLWRNGDLFFEISRELDRLELVLEHLKAVEAERDDLLVPASPEAAGEPRPAVLLMALKGVGPEFAGILWSESLFRSFAKRRQVATYAGLAPTPWRSGSIDRDEAGLPPSVLNIVTGAGSVAGQAIIDHKGVDKLVFTGSNPVGSKIMAAAARDIKRVSLELGGKSPFIVFEDANIDKG